MTAPCPSCGANRRTYIRHLEGYLIDGLRALAAHGGEGHTRDLGLSRSSYGNFARLRLFGLVEKIGGGRYRITDTGSRFLAGEGEIHTTLHVYRNRVVKRLEPMLLDDAEAAALGRRPHVELAA